MVHNTASEIKSERSPAYRRIACRSRGFELMKLHGRGRYLEFERFTRTPFAQRIATGDDKESVAARDGYAVQRIH